MPLDSDVVRLDGTPDYALHCPLRLLGLSVAPITTGLSLLASVGVTVSFLYLVGACNAFSNSGLGLISYLLLLVVLLGASMLRGLIGYAHTVVVWLLRMSCT